MDLLANRGFGWFLPVSVVCGLACLLPSLAVDMHYYRSPVLAVLNILKYNLVRGGGAELYGVEPWPYYFKNLFLNFNFIFVLALSSPLMFVLTMKGRLGKRKALGLMGTAKFTSAGLFLWLGFMTAQPHKEERFMYVIYPILCLTAGVTVAAADDMIEWWTAADGKKPTGWAGTFAMLFQAGRNVLLVVIVALSVARTVSMVTGFGATLDVYGHLSQIELKPLQQKAHGGPADEEVLICLGKEWHRFPSLFFLPRGAAPAFVRGGFDGQLPQRFTAQHGTWAAPPNFNGLNQDEPSRYVESTACHYYVDLELEGRDKPAVDPRFSEAQGWSLVHAAPFLDLERSPQLTRAFYIPFLSQRKNTYAKYTLRKAPKVPQFGSK